MNTELVGTPRCGVTARKAGGIFAVGRPITLDCAALRGADSGGSATCQARCPYHQSINPPIH